MINLMIDVNACPAIIREAFVRLNFSLGQDLPISGNQGRYVYIVLFGKIKVHPLKRVTLESGRLIGAMELFVDEPLNYVYQVQENTNVLRLDEHRFLEWMKMDHQLYQDVMQGLANYLEQNLERQHQLQLVK